MRTEKQRKWKSKTEIQARCLHKLKIRLADYDFEALGIGLERPKDQI